MMSCPGWVGLGLGGPGPWAFFWYGGLLPLPAGSCFSCVAYYATLRPSGFGFGDLLPNHNNSTK